MTVEAGAAIGRAPTGFCKAVNRISALEMSKQGRRQLLDRECFHQAIDMSYKLCVLIN